MNTTNIQSQIDLEMSCLRAENAKWGSRGIEATLVALCVRACSEMTYDADEDHKDHAERRSARLWQLIVNAARSAKTRRDRTDAWKVGEIAHRLGLLHGADAPRTCAKAWNNVLGSMHK